MLKFKSRPWSFNPISAHSTNIYEACTWGRILGERMKSQKNKSESLPSKKSPLILKEYRSASAVDSQYGAENHAMYERRVVSHLEYTYENPLSSEENQ